MRSSQRSERGGNLLRNRPRCLAQAPRELERDGGAEIAEVAIGRIVERQRRRRGLVNGVERGKQTREVGAEAIVNGQDHRESWYG